ncbi:MAG: tryptophan-rich sensory protein [Clostridia bacterium]
MKIFKALVSVCIGLAITLVFATVNSYIVVIGEWYNSLVLPIFAPTPTQIIICWSIIYFVSTIQYAVIVYQGKAISDLLFNAPKGLLQTIWCVVFFRAHLLAWSFVISIILLLYAVVWNGIFVKKYRTVLLGSLYEVAWYTVVCALCFGILMAN